MKALHVPRKTAHAKSPPTVSSPRAAKAHNTKACRQDATWLSQKIVAGRKRSISAPAGTLTISVGSRSASTAAASQAVEWVAAQTDQPTAISWMKPPVREIVVAVLKVQSGQPNGTCGGRGAVMASVMPRR